MLFGKRKLLTAFLEKDNLKLLAFEVSGKTVTRTFGGQISFTVDVVREAFIADPVKFSSQVKMALSQKPEVAEMNEVVLFIPLEKTFIKATPANDAIDSFVRSLPYFKEELIIDSDGLSSQKTTTDDQLINHTAFEKKLVEDLERPFLDSGKKILSALSNVRVLTNSFTQPGRCLFLISFEKDCVVLAMQDGIVLDSSTFPKDVFVGRLNEFRLGKNFGDIKQAFALGAFEAGILDKIKAEQGLNVSDLAGGDIYDLIASSYVSGGVKPTNVVASVPVAAKPMESSAAMADAVEASSNPGFLSGIKEKLPSQKILFLIGAAIVGFVLVVLVAKNLPFGLPNTPNKNSSTDKPTKQATPPPVVAPVLKPSDFKVRVLNGTTVAGEAGRAGEAITALGFDVTETTNATATGFAATRLRTTAEVPQEIIDQIKTALLTTYESVNMETLVDDVVKIEVIVGKKIEN